MIICKTLIRPEKEKWQLAKNLMDNFKLSDKQAAAILEMKLSTLSGLERKKIEDELAEKLKLIKELEDILKSEQKIKDIMRDNPMVSVPFP